MGMKEMLAKICHNEFTVEQIKEKERDILTTLDYELLAVTRLDFLKVYMEEMFGIEVLSINKTQAKEQDVIACHKNLIKKEEDNNSSDEGKTDASSTETSSQEGSNQKNYEEQERK